jgi:hypothetical protein
VTSLSEQHLTKIKDVAKKSKTSGKAGGLKLLTAQSGLIVAPPKGDDVLK